MCLKTTAKIIAGLCVLALASCSAPGKVQQNTEEDLSGRASLYWQSFTARDWDQLENLIDPEIRQKSHAYIQSLRESKPMAEYLSFEEKGLEIQGDRAKVTYELEIVYLHPMLQGLPAQKRLFTHEWVKRDSQWFVVIKQPNLKEILESITD